MTAKRFRIAPDVYEDLDEITRHLAEVAGPAIALKLAERLLSAVDRIEASPQLFAHDSRLGRNRRRLVEAPYLVVYEETQTEVIVLRIIHGARDLPTLFGS